MKILRSVWLLSLAAALAATGCAFPKMHNLPPANVLMEPGPGVGGPGPGVMMPELPPAVLPVAMPSVQLLFAKPESMQVRWDITGQGGFDSNPLVCPGRQNFPQNGIYRLKLTNIPGPSNEGLELYPTIEVAPTTPRSEAFLAHNAIPMQFTADDFAQVVAGNFVTKVIYLPDPEFQELALAGVETLVSTRLDPGVDPIVEADRRGAILAVIRLGNKDVEMAGAGDAALLGGMGPGGVGLAGYGACGPDGCGPHGGPGFGPGMYNVTGGIPPQFVSGVTAPQYGMTMSGTPIGLPGPPHIPLGGPAGLQKHVMKNHTKYHIPEPTDKLKISVRQQPGFSYPKPPSHARIREQSIHAGLPFRQPHWDKHEQIPGGAPYGNVMPYGGTHHGGGEYCPPGYPQ